jgi:hypothetical protein
MFKTKFHKDTLVSCLCAGCGIATDPVYFHTLGPLTVNEQEIFCVTCAKSHHRSFSNMLDETVGEEVESALNQLEEPLQACVMNRNVPKRFRGAFKRTRAAFHALFRACQSSWDRERKQQALDKLQFN